MYVISQIMKIVKNKILKHCFFCIVEAIMLWRICIVVLNIIKMLQNIVIVRSF